MRTATVSMSEISKAGRMDAPFHILNKEHANSVEALRKKYDDEEAGTHAQIIFNALPREHGLALASLSWTNRQGNPTAGELEKAIERYPHLALSVLLEQKESVLAAQQKRILKEEKALEVLRTQFEAV